MTISFKEPVSARMFVDAVSVLGGDRNVAWANPLVAADTIDMKAVTLDQAKKFMDIVLVEVPELDEDKFKALAAYCISGEQGFFSVQRQRYFEAHKDQILGALDG